MRWKDLERSGPGVNFYHPDTCLKKLRQTMDSCGFVCPNTNQECWRSGLIAGGRAWLRGMTLNHTGSWHVVLFATFHHLSSLSFPIHTSRPTPTWRHKSLVLGSILWRHVASVGYFSCTHVCYVNLMMFRSWQLL